MVQYIYKGRDKYGKPVINSITAKDEQQARITIQNQGIAITELIKQIDKVEGDILGDMFRTKQSVILAFVKQIKFLLNAGVPLYQSLSVVAEQITDNKFRGTVQNLMRDLSDGQNFSEALSHHPRVFPPILINSVKVSEINGRLTESLNTLADHLEREHELKAKIVTSFTYPAFVIFMALGVVVAMLVWVFPQFSKVFQEVNIQLPLPTRFLISLSEFLTGHWLILIIIGFGSLIILLSVRNNSEFRAFLDRAKFRLPLFGELFKKYIIIRLTSSLGTLLKTGVSIIDAIKLTGDVVQNSEVKMLMNEVAVKISEGQQIAPALAQAFFLPQFVIQTISIGEKSGQLAEMLMDLSAHYDREMHEKSQRLASAVEPAILLFLGVVVALIAVSVIIPLFRMPGAVRSTF